MASFEISKGVAHAYEIEDEWYEFQEKIKILVNIKKKFYDKFNSTENNAFLDSFPNEETGKQHVYGLTFIHLSLRGSVHLQTVAETVKFYSNTTAPIKYSIHYFYIFLSLWSLI